MDSRRKGCLLTGRPGLTRALLCCPCTTALSEAAVAVPQGSTLTLAFAEVLPSA